VNADDAPFSLVGVWSECAQPGNGIIQDARRIRLNGKAARDTDRMVC
jgi:hypothetical protein